MPKLTVALIETTNLLVDMAGGKWKIHIGNWSLTSLRPTTVTAAR